MGAAQKSEKLEKPSSSKRSVFASTVVLAAGLIMSPGCKSAGQIPPVTTQASGSIEKEGICEEVLVPKTLSSYSKGDCLVPEGAELFYDVAFCGDGFCPSQLKISKIDGNGIELEVSRFFNADEAGTKRINYGERKFLNKEFGLLSVKAKKTTASGAAIVNIEVFVSPAAYQYYRSERNSDDIDTLTKKITEATKSDDRPVVDTYIQTVKVGDTVRGGLFDNYTIPIRVTKIDENGVGLSNASYFEYDKPKILGEFLLMSNIRVLKDPGNTAVICVTHTYEVL